MKTKSSIAITAALALLATAAHAAVFTTDATIYIGDTTYDGLDIVVSNCTLTVNGPHSFASLGVVSNGVVTHSAAPNGEAGNLLSLTIAGNLGVDTLSRIDASGLGYAADQGPGAGGYGGGGGGHGGTGGTGGGAGGGGYDSVLTPSLWGSGGGSYFGAYGGYGGAGGGTIGLIVAGTLQLDGVIAADGASAGGYVPGGGAGGSIQISVGKLAGGGSISARGGGTANGGAGGGGRIALYFTTNNFAGAITAVGGLGYQNGGAGTLYTKLATDTYGQVLVDNGGNAGQWTPLTTPQPFALVVSNQARVYASAPLTNQTLTVGTNGLFSCMAGQSNVTLTVLGDLTVAAGGRIDVSGLGYAAQQGPGAGGYGGGGGGHGGTGGTGGGAGGGGYDSVLTPSLWGSGGGSYFGAYGGYGGAGGGTIGLIVAGTLQLDGVIAADGASAGGYVPGGGAGGSIQISAGKLAGGGSISARGGSTDINNGGGGGGGGRIALYFTTNNFAGAITAVGGLGYQNGGAGTIYTKLAADAYGQVLVNNGTNNGPNAGLTRLDSSLGSAGIFDLTISNATGYSGGALLLGSLLITTNAAITHPAGGPGIQIAVLGDATIQAGAGMVVDGRGYGSATGPGHGISSGYNGSGAGYGGPGGAGDNAGGLTYGSITAPVDFGSGGGTGGGFSGGAGGGAIRLTVSGTLLLNGRVTANGTGGTAWSEGHNTGGGSGGSVFLTVGRLAGNGAITANGGAAGNIYAGDGGGGRIAIYSSTNVFIGTTTADGGGGGGWGGTGTIYLSTNVAPVVIAQYPSGSVNRFVSYVDVTFNQPVDPATFTTNDLVLTAPSGPIPLSQTTLTGGGGVTWRIGFPTQFANGDYSFQLGPHIANLFGQEMETSYSGGFTVNFTTPTTTVSQTGGNLSLIWPSATGLSYQLQSATNLPAASWLNEGAPLNGTGGLLTNSLPIGVQPQKFFRFLLLEN